MFCANDVRSKWAGKIVRKYGKKRQETKYYNLIVDAASEDDIPQEIKDDVADIPDLQLYVDDYIDIRHAARNTTETHILISPVRHIEKFETKEDLDVLGKIIDAAWHIAKNTDLKDDIGFGISLKPGFIDIPHVHFHVNSSYPMNQIKFKSILDKKYFYLN
jgi:diadenosine tetraphosphate (Ap4A) HIT family hydrolase